MASINKSHNAMTSTRYDLSEAGGGIGVIETAADWLLWTAVRRNDVIDDS